MLECENHFITKGPISLELSAKLAAHFKEFVKCFGRKNTEIFEDAERVCLKKEKVNVTENRGESGIWGTKKFSKIKVWKFPRLHIVCRR